MDPAVLLPLLGLFGGLVLAVLAALRFQREDAGRVVTQQAQVFDNLRGLNDELGEALERCRKERGRLETEIDTCQSLLDRANGDRGRLERECKQLEANLRACRHEQERLEQRLVELGERPNG